MLASRNQNQLQSSLAPLGDLLKALMFLSNLNGFNSSPSLPIHGFNQRNGSSRVWKGKGLQVILSLSSLSSCFCLHLLCVFCFIFQLVQFYALLCLTYFYLVVFQFFLYFVLFEKKIKKSEKYKNSVCYVYIGICVPWMTIEIKFSKLCISCSLDEHLYAQLSK